jgi:mitochondrial fission protein ELM1
MHTSRAMKLRVGVFDVRIPTIWALTTGEAGMRAQALGLCERLGFAYTEKRIGLRAPWRWLPGHLCPFALRGLAADGDALAPPWPDLLVTCGRRSTAVSIAIRRASRGRTLTVHLQSPRTPPNRFDLVIAHPHDAITGDNVMLTETTIHRVTPDKLAAASAEFAARYSNLAHPRLAVLLGGRTRHGGFAAQDVARLVDILAGFRAQGHSVMITPSRRTEPALREAIASRFHDDPQLALWDGTGENPYFGMLALGDRILVTADSTSMVSEALATGKPVDLFEFSGMGPRHRVFAQRLAERGHAAILDDAGALATPRPETTPPPDAGELASARVRAMLESHMAAGA